MHDGERALTLSPSYFRLDAAAIIRLDAGDEFAPARRPD